MENLNLYMSGFWGFYESSFSPEGFIESEIEYLSELHPNVDEFNFDWEYTDRNKLFSRLSELILNSYVEEVNDRWDNELPLISNYKFVKVHMPREYNFYSDEIEFSCDLNTEGLMNYVKNNMSNFEKFLEDKFKSRSGFSSFYTYCPRTWLLGHEYISDSEMSTGSKLIYWSSLLEFYITNEDINNNFWDCIVNSYSENDKFEVLDYVTITHPEIDSDKMYEGSFD
ncbi:MAG: hypothetical protein E6R13_05730 [Spirochaetes bacterium]|nr:MAG: hypothetical protein E6R13_05730 [Spirochaetota bacterium]